MEDTPNDLLPGILASLSIGQRRRSFFPFERVLGDSNYIQFGYWDAGCDGPVRRGGGYSAANTF